MTNIGYMTGFGNEFATEALSGALPIRGNSPQLAPLGMYAEQLSGTAFTVSREFNRRTWFYRIRLRSFTNPSTKETMAWYVGHPSTACRFRPTNSAGRRCPCRTRRSILSTA